MRAHMQVPHQDTDGEPSGECRRAMGRNIISVPDMVSGRESGHKPGVLSAKVSVMSLKGMLIKIGDKNGIVPD
eukprot:9221859-Prorocentrum_lima.AAC.1